MDVLEYWLGAYAVAVGDGFDEEGNLFEIAGIDDPFAGLRWGFDGGDGAENEAMTASFVSTSGILSRDEYPQFNTWPSARWDKPGGPFAPHTGTQYVYSQIADVSYKRLTREIAVPAGGGDLTFWTSYDTEHDWDFMFVEARTPGGDNWTTLPDANGHTSQSTGAPTPPGGQDQASCPAGWADLHPHLMHYQTETANGLDCTPTGTTGVWNAASGNSGGWQEWRIDLDAYAGNTVEISIAYVSDWAVQNLGVFLDDVTLPDGTQHVVRGRPRRLDTRAAGLQRHERQQLAPHRRLRVPGRRHHQYPGLAAVRLRVRGHRDGDEPQRGHAPLAPVLVRLTHRGEGPPSICGGPSSPRSGVAGVGRRHVLPGQRSRARARAPREDMPRPPISTSIAPAAPSEGGLIRAAQQRCRPAL